MASVNEMSLVVLKQVAKLLDKLSEDQLVALVAGRAELAFVAPDVTVRANARRSVAPRQSRAPKPTTAEAAAKLSSLTDRAQAVEYLGGSGLTVADLKAVARELRITIPSKATKDNVIEQLAQGTVGFRSKFDAVIGGARQR